MSIVQFFAWVIRLALLLAIIGQLKFCTLVMLGKASEASQVGFVSYSRFTKMLTR